MLASDSAARFAVGDDLETAQQRKIELLLDRLELKAGDRLLEVGCGWGALAIAAVCAEGRFGCVPIVIADRVRKLPSCTELDRAWSRAGCSRWG